MTELDMDNLLDELETLRRKRLAEIQTNGIDIRCLGSAKEFRAIFNADGTLWTEPKAALSRFSVITSAKGDYIITATEQKAGRTLVKAVPAFGRLDVFNITKSGQENTRTKLTQKASSVPCHRADSTLQVAPGYIFIGDVVKTASGSLFLVVETTRLDSGMIRLSLNTYTDPAAQPVQSYANSFV